MLIKANPENPHIDPRTLAQPDRPNLQVAIDSTVAEVTLNDNLSYGVQFFLQTKKSGVLGNISNIPTDPPGKSSVNAAGLVGAPLHLPLPRFTILLPSESHPTFLPAP